VALNAGVLIAWMCISCLTMPVVQWYVRRKAVIAERSQRMQAPEKRMSTPVKMQATPPSTDDVKHQEFSIV
jgi:hypothetical protein